MDKDTVNVPLECPSNQQKTKVDTIVNVVEKEIFPTQNNNTTSKIQQE